MERPLVIFVMLLFIFGCRSLNTNVYEANDKYDIFVGFKIIRIEKDFLRIEKYSYTIIGIEKGESKYQVLIPNAELKETSSTLNIIPSEHFFKFNDGSLVYIVKNGHIDDEKIKHKGYFKLNKEELLDLIYNNDISGIDGVKLKNNKFHGVHFYDQVAIIYLNVHEANVKLFNTSISSLLR